MTSGRLLARNSALNLLGQSLPVLAAVVAIPPLVRGLGEDRFGVLTLAWAAIGYFSLFELGLSRALTQAVAQRLGNGSRDDLPGITWAALVLLLGFGLLGGLVLTIMTPLLTTRILNIPSGLQREAQLAFWILAAALPLVLTTAGLRGLMEAHQHFGIATLIRVPLVAFTFVGPLLLLPYSHSLVPAVFVLAIGRLLGMVAHLWACLRMYPFLKKPLRFQRAPTMALLRFGGWSTVSNVVSPMMVYLDRFFIGAMLTVVAVAYYVTPYEVVVKLLIIPVSLIAAVLPAFAATIQKNPQRMTELYDKSMRGLMLATFPAVLVAVALAHEGLRLWMGAVLPNDSAVVAQWLAIGVFVTAIAQAPLAALQGAGRPDLVAKLHLVELPFYIVALVLLMRAFGLSGVAIAWTLRCTADAAALLWLTHRSLRLPLFPRLGGAWALTAMLAALAAAALLTSTQARVAYVAAVMLAFVPLGWSALLASQEREGLLKWLKSPGRVERQSVEELI
jgi:O-antigen/teichoic acid export membrane protein